MSEHQTTPPSLLSNVIKISDTSLMDLEEQNGWNAGDNVIGLMPQYGLQTPPATPQYTTNAADSTSGTRVHALQVISNAFETALVDHEAHEWELEDPDLMPTIDDWMLVYTARHASTVRFGYDRPNCLNSFFQQPPMFRLIICAVSALSIPLPDEIQFSYYNRCRKAVVRAIHEKPTYQTVQSLMMLFQFAEARGQPDISRSLFQTALSLIKSLRLDIDPDLSPWLAHLNLTERQKEDRRRAFWCSYSVMVTEEAVSNETFANSETLSSVNIKPPATIHDPYLVFEGNIMVKPECELLRLIGQIRRGYSRIPKTLNDLLPTGPPPKSTDLNRIISEIPTPYLLVPADSPSNITRQDHLHFLHQLSQMPANEVPSCLSVNFLIYSTTSVLYRSQLYLSACQSCHPMFLSTLQHHSILQAIQKSFDAALQTAQMYYFLRKVNAGAYPQWNPTEDVFFDLSADSSIYMVFEATTVLWFLYCRMKPVWWASISAAGGGGSCGSDGGGGGRERPQWSSLRIWIVEMVDLVKRVSVDMGSAEGTCEPLLFCMQAMLAEMDQMQLSGGGAGGAGGAGGGNSGRGRGEEEDQDEGGLVLGMKLMALGSKVPTMYGIKEPRAFLGLLGLDVSGGIRWRGCVEQGWKMFWKLFS
ncbi:hypothetical protein BDR26DRAFT_880245 [Obelidium mucronatum]|nr:hypothetical protein BDR26DRAFT_880245 [Obelidium mucronatum]